MPNEFEKIISKPAQRALAGAGIENLEQLSKFKESEIMSLHGIGEKGVERLRVLLSDKGLSFAR